jgi:predicted phosphodiesterase
MNILGDLDIIGDTHGKNTSITRWAEVGDTENLIHVGDYGIGFKGSYPKTVKLGQLLNETGKNVYVVRGNHDDPSFFDGRIYGGSYGGIHFVKDGTIANWKDKNILFNGGAVSIDRFNRINHIDMWETENFSPLNEIDTEIDYLVTHSSFPEVSSFPILGDMVKVFAKRDENLVSDLTNEAKAIKEWLNYLIGRQEKQIKIWHYGHFHKSFVSNYEGIKCVCLNIEEIRPFDPDLMKKSF